MDSNFLDQFLEIINSIKIESQDRYSFRGKIFETSMIDLPDTGGNSKSPPSRYLSRHMSRMIYQYYHTRRNTPPFDFANFDLNALGRDYLSKLSTANSGTGTWEFGWELMKQESSGYLQIQKDDLRLWVRPEQFIHLESDLLTGAPGYVRMPKEFQILLTGFYGANGNAIFDGIEERKTPLVRLYWNLNYEGAIIFVRELTRDLNLAGIPFRLKVPNNRYFFPRADSCVLYIRKKHLRDSVHTLTNLYRQVRGELNSETPVLAKRLALGISLAEDPNTGESFGQNRSRLLSEAIVLSFNMEGRSNANLVDVRRYLKENMVDMDCPYVNPPNSDDYDRILGASFTNEAK